MTKKELLLLKNEMLVANCMANLIGVFLAKIFILGTESPMPDHVFQIPVVDLIDSAFTPFAFLFVGISMYIDDVTLVVVKFEP